MTAWQNRALPALALVGMIGAAIALAFDRARHPCGLARGGGGGQRRADRCIAGADVQLSDPRHAGRTRCMSR